MAYPKRTYSEAEIKEIVEYYKTHNITKTARRFHTITPNVRKILVSQNVKIKLPGNCESNICMSCQRAARFIELPCPWASKFEPVEGWTAEEICKIDGGQEVHTYYITKCPLYMMDEWKGSYDE